MTAVSEKAVWAALMLFYVAVFVALWWSYVVGDRRRRERRERLEASRRVAKRTATGAWLN